MKNRISKWLSWLLIFALILSNIPGNIAETVVLADEGSKTVRVIVRNDTYTTANGAKWDGVLLDKWVEVDETSTTMTAVAEAVKSENYTITGAENGYISEIAGIAAYDNDYMSGWMGTINDWFTNQSLSAYTIANGGLEYGDEICMSYTSSWGSDIGSDWSSTSTALAGIEFSEGTLDKAFEKNVMSYNLIVPKGTTSIKVQPTAENKNFMVKTYKNSYTPTEKGTEIKRNQSISINEGDKIYVGVGYTDSQDSSKNWPSMNSGHTGSVYEFTVQYETEVIEKPAFEQFNFLSSSLANWTTNETYDRDVLEYDVNIKAYSTSSLLIQSTTKFDTDKYEAYAKYTDINGNDNNIEIVSGKMTTLSNIPFGKTTLKVVISDKTNAANYTEYTFYVTRPYDTTAQLNTSTGMVIVPEGRELLSTSYLGKAEGTLFKIEENGELGTPGMSASCVDYKAYVLDNLDKFTVKLTGKTAYVHIRISENGTDYTEVVSGSNSPVYTVAGEKKLTVQTISDAEYLENGFDNVEELGTTYTLTVEAADADTSAAKILSAAADFGDFYPAFDKDTYSNVLVIDYKSRDELVYPTLTFTASEGAEVTVGNNVLEQNEDGSYTLVLKATAQTVKVAADNGIVNSYSFRTQVKSQYAVPDKIVDYLCINSQYTNASFGVDPTTTLGGSIKSLGNFGGYITYYYENAITDDPSNKYGVDFYVYGNAYNGPSFAECGQVWVSEDGENWFALAGSEHYEDTTIKDYEITYTRTESGKTAWTDNYGGSNDGTLRSGRWVSSSVYYMNDLAKNDTITLKGILLPCADGTLYGDGTTAAFASQTSFGYSDAKPNGTIGADVNPYAEEKASNGFDLKWAVDEEGNPVEFENGIHYIKVVTASNIWAGAFNEKSTEVGYVIRTAEQEENVGVTEAPAIAITDESGNVTTVDISEDTQVYDVKLNDSRMVTISVEGSESDNIYVNNQRIASGEGAEIQVNDNGKKVRIIVQNGEKEPVLYILNLESEYAEKLQNIYKETTEYLSNCEIPTVSSIGGEWIVIGLARAGQISDTFKEGYFKNVYDYVKAVDSDKLSNSKSTDNSRVILALTSLGYDVTDIAGHNLLAPLSDLDYICRQGINGSIWALIALDSADYEIPQADEGMTQATRDNIIEQILAGQMENGAYSLDGENPDVDITAMAIQALTPYYESDEAVRNVVDNAIAYLSSVQNEDGSFGSFGDSNAESTAQVVVALSGLSINPRTDAGFIKNGVSVISALSDYYLGNGNFAHVTGGEINQMSTEQAYLALVAFNRLLNVENNIYDMTDVVRVENPVIKDEDDNKGNEDNGSDGGDNSDDKNLTNSGNNVNDDNKSDGKSDYNADKNNSQEALPKTGDYNNILMYVMTGMAAGTYIIFRRRRKITAKTVNR